MINNEETAMEQMFPVFDMETSVIEFHFIGMSGDYAVTRVKQKLEKISGPASFKSNVSEQVFVFKKNQGKWKIWQAVMLDMDYL